MQYAVITALQKYLLRNNNCIKIFKQSFKIMASGEQPKDILGFEAKDIDGNQVSLSKYKGFVSLIVNVASK